MGGKLWQRVEPDVLESLRQRLQVAYPEIHLLERGDVVVARGTFPLIDGGRVIDRYMIEVELPHTYPMGLPIVREIGGRIPLEADRHVEGDGHACVFLPDEYCYRHPNGMDLLDFLGGPVLGFLVGQSLVERGQPWPQGERGHGRDGILEFYGPLLATADRHVIEKFLDVLAASNLRGHWTCPCGSGKRIRDCHRDQLTKLRERIPTRVARTSLNILTRMKAPV